MRRFISYLGTVSFYVIAAVICALLNAEIIPDIAGTASTMYLFTLATAAYMYVNHRATPRKSLKLTIQHLMLMGLMLLFLRGLKYSAFKETEILARHTWYMYYVPTLLIPLLLSASPYSHFQGKPPCPGDRPGLPRRNLRGGGRSLQAIHHFCERQLKIRHTADAQRRFTVYNTAVG